MSSETQVSLRCQGELQELQRQLEREREESKEQFERLKSMHVRLVQLK